jgi:hypothetical protein
MRRKEKYSKTGCLLMQGKDMEHSIDKLKPCNCGTYSVKRGWTFSLGGGKNSRCRAIYNI